MAAADQGYSKTSIEDDFNYGSNVVSASVHIRMEINGARSVLYQKTLLEALTIAITVTFYEVFVVLQAFILTTAVFLALTVYTLQSKRDFSKAGLFACLWILLLSGFLRIIFYSEVAELVFAAAGALLFCGFIIYATHLLMHKLSPEEYILASINLYLDIINLFLHLLRLLEAFNNK
ncbi:protein lifeguard 4 [Heteronotia binoei]|uniref:protein lifeguard 4 n=1 Tax=Heteronotia binoei TaxID=13085 RepID=UPI002931990F|nr:protein lifeguard 4 [Heteronotia binoei]